MDQPQTAAECRALIKRTNRRIHEAKKAGWAPENIADLRKQVAQLKEHKRYLNRAHRDNSPEGRRRFECVPVPEGTFWQSLRGHLAETDRAQERLLEDERKREEDELAARRWLRESERRAEMS